MASVAVVGAGMVGVSTADLLRCQLPSSINITLLADKFTSETTSYGAAGVFRMNDCNFVEASRVCRWLELSFNYYHDLARSSMAPLVGANVVKLYHLFSEPDPPRPLFTYFSYDYRPLTEIELKYLKTPSHCVGGFLLSTVMIEPRHYLPFLLDSFKHKGGIVSKRTISSWSELKKEFDLVINCTGAGARTLCNDDRIYPVRGQVVRVKAPWLRRAFTLDNPDVYIYPGRDSVVLGGIREIGNWSSEISQTDTDAILERSKILEPSLVHAPIEEIWAGVRPCRDQIRVETDPDTYDVPMIHNYGHGGHGILLAYATAVDVVNMTKKMLKTMKAKI